jgi:crossover junction endodeoxyribonuclease RuvC
MTEQAPDLMAALERSLEVTPSVRLVGMDLSLSATGIADVSGATVFKPKHTVPMIRLNEFDTWIREWIHIQKPSMVVIEGYAYGAKNQREALGELHGVIRLALHQATVPFALVAPTQLKKFATGIGNANKDTMIGEAARIGCPANDNNAVDAWWLYKMACEKYSMYDRITGLPKAQRDVVNKVEWPMRFAS